MWTLFIEGDYQTSVSLSGIDLSQNSRRLSTRSIKRKKFDDELVESSLIKSDRARPRQQSVSDPRTLLPSQSTSLSSVVTERIDLPTPPVTVERKKVHKVCMQLLVDNLPTNQLAVSQVMGDWLTHGFAIVFCARKGFCIFGILFAGQKRNMLGTFILFAKSHE